MTEQKYTLPYVQVKAFDPADIPDQDCPLPERALWWQLRDVYAKYRAGTITKEVGEQLKQKAILIYEKDRKDYTSMRDIVQHQAEMWSRIETAARDYAKSNNRTPEADAFYKAVYGCKLKDGDYNGE